LKRVTTALAGLLALSLATVRADALGVGDPAPELKVGGWVQGGPIDRLDPEGTYVVEFWATWCGPCVRGIPHVNELAGRFTNVTFIGMNVWEGEGDVSAKVAAFVKKMGADMTYPVAIEGDEQFMAKEWMEAAGQDGIPAAFVVHRGTIAWIGHPMSDLNETLESLADGTFDMEKVKQRAVIEGRLDAFFEKAFEGATDEELAEEGRALEELDGQMGGILPGARAFSAAEAIRMARFQAALRRYQEALMAGGDEAAIAELRAAARDGAPDIEQFDRFDEQMREQVVRNQEMSRIQAVFTEYVAAVGEDGNPEEAAKLAAKLEAMEITDARLLNEIAWDILTSDTIRTRDLPLATRLAEKAMALTEEKEASIVDTYARALFDAGDIAGAIRYQEKAVALDAEDPDLATVLERYRAAAAGH